MKVKDFEEKTVEEMHQLALKTLLSHQGENTKRMGGEAFGNLAEEYSLPRAEVVSIYHAANEGISKKSRKETIHPRTEKRTQKGHERFLA